MNYHKEFLWNLANLIFPFQEKKGYLLNTKELIDKRRSKIEKWVFAKIICKWEKNCTSGLKFIFEENL